MNTKLMDSKKFKASLLGIIVSLLTFFSTKFGLNLTDEQITLLSSIILIPTLGYVLSEGYSEVEAKKVVEENKIRKSIVDQAIALNKEESNEN